MLHVREGGVFFVSCNNNFALILVLFVLLVIVLVVIG
ncbi:YjcZ family sporulation protein [Brevibacillus sp. RS1.1]